MSLYFLDSRALVRRYVTETGSNWIRALTDPATRNPLIISRITWVEVLSALARRQREGSITLIAMMVGGRDLAVEGSLMRTPLSRP